MNQTVSLRPISENDQGFLYRVYASTRSAELAQTDWDGAQKAAFLRTQFNAQHQQYMQRYAPAQFDLIVLNGEPIGRLYVARWPREIRIVDIALLSPYRRHGIGSALLHELLAEGGRRGVPVTIHVERFNPALDWYERLGFRQVEDKGVYLFMARPPAGPSRVDGMSVERAAHAG